MNYRLFLILLAIGTALCAGAQEYSAIHGSSRFASLNVYNNPSSIVSTPYRWDVTIFGMQYQTISNAVKGSNFPLMLSSSATFYAADGNYERMVDASYNVRLLNFRYSIDKRHAVAFGLNFRGYVIGSTSPINYTDSVKGPRSFLSLNEQNKTISANVAGSAWMELYGSYGLNIIDNGTSSLNVGASLKVLRGMAGGFAKVNGVGVEREVVGDQVVYKIVGGDARYGYSANFGDGESFRAGDLFSGSQTGLALDIGAEYLVKSQAVGNYYDEPSEDDYEWKIGVSLLDLGWNNYVYISESRMVSSLKEDISSATLSDKFMRIQHVGSFNDSLATIVDNYDPLSGKFSISNPARAVINVDRYLSGNFYVNGELSVNLAGGKGKNIAVSSAKLLTVTPRWETRRLGVYVPVQYNRHGNFWIGGAVKAGPVLLGTHNLLNAFSKNKYLGGGAYLAIIIHPANFVRDARSRQYECPEY
jgi:hypothetical protein